MAKTNTIKYHASIGAALAYIDETKSAWRCKASTDNEASERWDLSTGWRKAVSMARDGWNEGRKEMEVRLASIPARGSMARDAFDIAGGYCNVGRYIAERPDCMVTKKRDAERSKRPVISLAVNIYPNCQQRAECIANYGLAVAYMVEALERAGQRVEVLACAAAEGDTREGASFSVGWTVKEAHEYLNIADLAFSVGHPASVRRIGFALMERTPVELGGHGYPRDITLERLPSDWQDMPGLVILNGVRQANDCAATPEAAIAHLERKIAEAIAEHESRG